MLVERINPLTGLPFNVELNITEAEIKRHNKKEHVQNVWPNLTPDQREFYLSGVPMGLFESQFEKHFVVIVNKDEHFRYEIYFSRFLNRFFVFTLESNTFKNIHKFDWNVVGNKIQLINDSFVFVDLDLIVDEINMNFDLLLFCRELKRLFNTSKYSYMDILDIINQYSSEYRVGNPSVNKEWLDIHLENN